MYAKIKQKSLLIIAALLILFGTFNLAKNSFAQEQLPADSSRNALSDAIIERLLTEIGPIVGGIVTIGIQFARKQGLRISAEAEAYFVNSAKSFVENQSRWLYKQIKDNPKYEIDFQKGKIPKELGQAALDNVKKQLEVELKSDEFTKTAREMLSENLETLVERFVTEHRKEQNDKARELLHTFVPIVVDAALLAYKNSEEVRNNQDGILKEAIKSLTEIFAQEQILLSLENAKIYVKSELYKKTVES